MKKRIGTIFTGGLLLMSLQAATIDWTTADITDISDVNTNGTTVTAVNAAGSGANSIVTFAGIDFNQNTSVLDGNYNGDVFAYDTGDTNYNEFLNDLDYATSAATGTVTFADLTVTGDYLVQFWYADDGGFSVGRTITLEGSGDNILNGNDYAVGTFTADAETQVLTFVSSRQGARITGYQLRALFEVAEKPVISWTTNAITGFETDVVTNGTLIEAVNGVGGSVTTSPTINGVTFTADGTLLANSWTGDPWTPTATNAAYDQLLSTIDYEGSGTGPRTIKTFSGLTDGAEYLIQFWYAESAWQNPDPDRTMTLGGTGSNTVNGVSYAVGTFTGNEAGEADLIVTASHNGPRLTAYQLRAISGHIPVEPDPEIGLSGSELNFGTVYVGETNSLTVTVKNIGGGTLDGSASVVSPFFIESGAVYSLTNDQEQVVTILFVPESAGDFTETLSFTGGEGASVSVAGTGGILTGTLAADIAGDYIGPSAEPDGWDYLYSDAAVGGTEVALTPDTAVASSYGSGNNGFGDTNGLYNIAAVLGSVTGSGQYEIFSDGYDGNASSDGNLGVPGTDLLLHPGSSNENAFVIVRYTLSAEDLGESSLVDISGSFREEVGKTTDPAHDSITAEIYHNSTNLFSVTGADGRLWQTNGTFNITNLTVAIGDTISFVVGNNGIFTGDETALTGTIQVQESAVPVLEPGVEVTAGNIEFTFSGMIGQNYQVQLTESLSVPDWKPVLDVDPLTESSMDVSMPLTNEAAFYRIIHNP
ncbi:hypothetical protein [Pontiella sp.]|uniref:hypothetical protein n=1 Tax=Pontiella sp. TaxID=2837462 RepID=UPI003565B95D